MKRLRTKRNNKAVEKAIASLGEEASKSPLERKNPIYLILEAASARATTGEISGALRSAYGEYRPKLVI